MSDLALVISNAKIALGHVSNEASKLSKSSHDFKSLYELLYRLREGLGNARDSASEENEVEELARLAEMANQAIGKVIDYGRR